MQTMMIAPSLNISLLSLSLIVAPGCSKDTQLEGSESGLKVEFFCGGRGCSAFVEGATLCLLHDPAALTDVRKQVSAFRHIPDEYLVAREVEGGIIISRAMPTKNI